MNHIFHADQVTKNYNQHCALDHVSIHVPEQSIFGLLGPNGAGKTTLIRIINQIIAPDSGKLFLDGKPLTSNDVQQIGYLPEERGLYKKMKVGEQAIYLARLKGLDAPAAKKQLREWFEKFDLMAWWDKKVEELSKGMQQKVQFIITVLHKPRLLIFDEPFSGFDPINVNLLKQEIMKLRKDGATIIFSTHNMGSVEELCDHIALINKSRKILDGSVRDIRKEYAGQLFHAEMQYDKPLTADMLSNEFELIGSATKNGLITARIRAKDHAAPNDLLRQLINISQLVSFNELIPSMNDIFIKHVTGHFPANNEDSTE
jgi:ABC-2 type transport system ATP-binding protein